MTEADRVLDRALSGPGAAVRASSTRAWLDAHLAEDCEGAEIDAAILGGLSADRIGFAFAAGYEAALRRLDPTFGRRVASFSATEEAGNHPRAIRAALTPGAGGAFTLSGQKRWATLAPVADVLLVVCTEGVASDGRPALRVARVRTDAAGLVLEEMPPTPFVPEVPHAVVRFESVRVEAVDVLPRDGYDGDLKPFRTLEDTHVHAAAIGYALGVARRHGLGRDLREALGAHLLSVRSLALGDPSSPAVHVALAGALAVGSRLFERIDAEWPDSNDEERARFRRDRALFGVAEKARIARREKAWKSLDERR